MTTTPVFTIFRRTCIGILGEHGERLGTEERVQRYTMPGHDARSVVEDLIENLAEDDDRLVDLSPSDEEFDIQLSFALEDVEGMFSAYDGELTDRPDAAPLHEEGDLGEPTHWERKKAATA